MLRRSKIRVNHILDHVVGKFQRSWWILRSDLLAVNRLKCWISLNRRAGASDQRRTVAILGYENSSNRVRVLCAVNIRLPVNRPRKIHRYPFLLDVGVSPISNLISHRSVEAGVVGEAAGDLGGDPPAISSSSPAICPCTRAVVFSSTHLHSSSIPSTKSSLPSRVPMIFRV